ncbi:MAG: hypothetical protein ABIO76_02935 [Ginsengibacter sp.]
MNKFIYSLFLILFFMASCRSSRNSIASTQEDKLLLAALKKLDKNSNDTTLQNSFSKFYFEAAKVHLDNIDIYNTLIEVAKWNKIIKEYESLQRLTDVINSSITAKRLVKAPPYGPQISVAKQNAASDFYNIGVSYLQNNDKESFHNAYLAFQKSQEFDPGYKDAKRQMDVALQNSILNVVVNPVTDNSFYYNNAGWNSYGNSFNNDYLQRNLVRDLGGDYNKKATVRFYTDRDANNADINPDLIVDLTWLNLDVPSPYTSQYSRNVSKQIEKSRDTSGHSIYETVTGTLYITKKYFTATGDLETRITNAYTRNIVDSKRYTAQFNWQMEYASYRGDSRALSGNDLAMLNNTNIQVPRKEDILNELYQRIYPQVKNGIYNSVRW